MNFSAHPLRPLRLCGEFRITQASQLPLARPLEEEERHCEVGDQCYRQDRQGHLHRNPQPRPQDIKKLALIHGSDPHLNRHPQDFLIGLDHLVANGHRRFHRQFGLGQRLY